MDHVGIDIHKAVPGGAGSRGHRRRPGLRADVRDEEAPREDGRAGCASAAITETCRPGSRQATGTRAGRWALQRDVPGAPWHLLHPNRGLAPGAEALTSYRS